jgi:DNA-binding CsgD family transcriptional regulator
MSQLHHDVSKRALARIQRLCCLGVGGEMLMPDLLREIAQIMHSRHEAFNWHGRNGEISNAYSSFPAELEELYIKEFAGRSAEAELRGTFGDLRSWSYGTRVTTGEQILRVDTQTWLQSEYYNILWRPAEIHHQLMLIVTAAGRPQGVLYAYRSQQDAPFETAEIKMLGAIGKFVAHGLTAMTLGNDTLVESDDRALLVVNIDGVIQHATVHAQRLLLMALGTSSSSIANWRSLREPAPEILRLCRLLTDTADGQIGQTPPALRLRAAWGEFILRGYWLGLTDGIEHTGQIGITIERRVPRVLMLRRRVEDLPLTAREKQFCLLLARNPSRQGVADAMGVAVSTTITYQRSIYAKLGVHSRAALLMALQGP